MSTNGNEWTPRKSVEFTCPSGKKGLVRRPGPELMLRSGRAARTFTKAVTDRPERRPEQSIEDYNAEIFEQMSDEELTAVTLFARDLVCAMLVSPRLVLNPREGHDEMGPDDVPPIDFWALFNYGMTNFIGIKVPVGDTEVEAEHLETFRAEPGIQGDSVDGIHVPVSESEPAATDQGLVSSAGN